MKCDICKITPLRGDNRSGHCQQCRAKRRCVICEELQLRELGPGKVCGECRETMNRINTVHKEDEIYVRVLAIRRQGNIPNLELRRIAGLPLFGD